MTIHGVDLEQALQDPASVFASPEEVAAHPGFTREQKIEILRLWEYDASRAAPDAPREGDSASCTHASL